jgi:hypothetical protein
MIGFVSKRLPKKKHHMRMGWERSKNMRRARGRIITLSFLLFDVARKLCSRSIRMCFLRDFIVLMLLRMLISLFVYMGAYHTYFYRILFELAII